LESQGSIKQISTKSTIIMKKTKATQLFRNMMLFLGVFSLLTLAACREDEDVVPEPIASFQYEIDETEFLKVTFENYSRDAVSYSWNFGDGQTSSEENPIHTYAAPGNYEVVLVATNSANASANFSQTIEVKDPNEALTLLTGQTSKTWKLYRVGTSMGVGPNPNSREWWSLENDGTRPCVYTHEFTFHRDGRYTFDDNGIFWGESGVFPTALVGTCFEATAANMINVDGANVSAWLSGTHSFTYVPSTGMVTISGMGAWIGLPKVTTSSEVKVPQQNSTFRIDITQHEGYDLMEVLFMINNNEVAWTFTYASYSDPSLEPEIVTESAPWGEDLPNVTPSEMFITFASREAAQMATIDTITSGSSVVFGVDDPADASAPKVGRFIRTAGVQWQELQFRTVPNPMDIQFDNFTKAKIDVYIPSGVTFAEGALQRHLVFGFADMSQTQEWWNSPVQFIVDGNNLVVGQWTTYEFDLTDAKARQDLDMIYLGIGGGGHEVGGEFYIRNLRFE
jgi:PKD repeat protein